jgi:hypothetical protein
MYARMTQRVLGQALDLIDGLGGIRVTHEFRIEIARVIRLQQREPEIVHCENVFQKFRGLEIADSTCLASSVESVRCRVGASVEVVVVL